MRSEMVKGRRVMEERQTYSVMTWQEALMGELEATLSLVQDGVLTPMEMRHISVALLLALRDIEQARESRPVVLN